LTNRQKLRFISLSPSKIHPHPIFIFTIQFIFLVLDSPLLFWCHHLLSSNKQPRFLVSLACINESEKIMVSLKLYSTQLKFRLFPSSSPQLIFLVLDYPLLFWCFIISFLSSNEQHRFHGVSLPCKFKRDRGK
jgi:hypothetical protein